MVRQGGAAATSFVWATRGRAGMPGLRFWANNDNGTRAVDFGSAGASPSRRGSFGSAGASPSQVRSFGSVGALPFRRAVHFASIQKVKGCSGCPRSPSVCCYEFIPCPALFQATFLTDSLIGRMTGAETSFAAASMKASKICRSSADAVELSGCHWTPRQNQSSSTDS